MDKKRVLVFPCGSEVGLEVNRALALDIHFELFGASSVPDHGCFVYKNYIGGVPFVDDDDFIDVINKICQEYKIDFIIPTMDSVILKLASNADGLKAKLVTSPFETCQIACFKSKTYEKLKNIIHCPKIYSPDDDIKFPVFVKPDFGYGSRGAKIIKNREELLAEYSKDKNIIISEYLPGEEFTIDCFTDKDGKLLFCGGRKRARIRGGVSVNSFPVKNPEFKIIAEKINSALNFRGVWFFQLKMDFENNLVLMEFAPRLAGTMDLYRGLGVNLVLLSLYDAMGVEVSIIENNFMLEIDRALFAKYKHNINYDYVYIDFDDTIICEDKVNISAVAFLYQAKNLGKKVILITKHNKNISETLAKFSISENLFDEIIQLEKTDSKADYIKYKNAIFIDDSFSERLDASENTGVAVFGIDAIDVLLDYKN